MVEKKKNPDAFITWSVMLITGIVLLMVVYKATGMYYETNDDIFISKILSGIITGKNDYHTIYNSVLFSAPLCLLYYLIPSVQWYGVSILVIKFLTFCIPAIVIIKRLNNFFYKIFVYICSVNLFFLFLYLHSYPQYTSTAACAAFSGFIIFLFEKNKKEKYIWFVILEFAAYGLRPQAMMMVLPFGFALVGGYSLFLILESKKQERKNVFTSEIKPFSIAVAIILFLLGTGMLSYRLAYSGSEWEDSLSVSDAGIVLFDYYGTPNSDQVESILEKNEISSVEYEAYRIYLNYCWDNSNGVLEEIVNYVIENNKDRISIQEIFIWFIQSYREWPWKLWLIIFCLFGFEIVLIITLKKYKILIMNASYFVAKAIVWGYLYIGGRMPQRIMLPLYGIEIAFELSILIILITNIKELQKNKICLLETGAFLGIILFFSCFCVREQYSFIYNRKASIKILSQIESEVGSYFDQKKDDKFLLSILVYSDWKSGILQRHEKANYRYGGGWIMVIPDAQANVDEYLGDGVFYFVTGENDSYIHKEIEFFEKKYHSKVEQVDSFGVSTGGYYSIYKIEYNTD